MPKIKLGSNDNIGINKNLKMNVIFDLLKLRWKTNLYNGVIELSTVDGGSTLPPPDMPAINRGPYI